MTKPTKWHVRPAKTQISLGLCPVWSESLLSAWRKLRSLATNWAHSIDSDQTGRMPRLIWVFAGRTVILLVLSWGGSYDYYSSFWDVQKFLGSLRYFYRSSLKSLHLMYFDLYTKMFLNFFEQSGLGKHCRPRPDCFRQRGAWSQSTLFVIQFAGITLMAKPYCSYFKIITAIVQVPKFFQFLLWMWQILIWHM